MEMLMWFGAVGVVCLLIVLSSCQEQPSRETLATFQNAESLKASNIELAKQFYRHVDGVKRDSLGMMFASDAKIFYQSAEPKSFAEIGPLIETFYTSFPDYKHEIQDIFASDDKVVVRILYSGTFTNKFMDITPNRVKFTYKGIHIFQFANNKIFTAWVVEDELSMMTQLGMELKLKK